MLHKLDKYLWVEVEEDDSIHLNGSPFFHWTKAAISIESEHLPTVIDFLENPETTTITWEMFRQRLGTKTPEGVWAIVEISAKGETESVGGYARTAKILADFLKTLDTASET